MAVKYGTENKNVNGALLELTVIDPPAFTYRNIKTKYMYTRNY